MKISNYKLLRKGKRTGRGFTLLEILVVMAIIILLAAILFPAFERAQNSANRASCQSNLKQLALGIQMYKSDYDETYPLFRQEWQTGLSGTGGQSFNGSKLANVTIAWNRTGWAAVIQPYTKSEDILQCPSGIASPRASSYPRPAYQSDPGQMGYSAYFYNSYLGRHNGCYPGDSSCGYAADKPSLPETKRDSAVVAPALTFLLGDGSLNGYVGDGNGGVSTAASAAHGGGMNQTGRTTDRLDAGLADYVYDGSAFETAFQPNLPTQVNGNYPNPKAGAGNSALRHLEGANYAFCDGHVKWLNPDQVTIRRVSAGDFTFRIN